MHVEPVFVSAAMRQVLAMAEMYARLPRPSTLLGQTGVGKGWLARRMHSWSGAAGSFVVVTGGQLSDSLFHSQLFGHVRGAFTDAKDRVKGAFEQAADGTVFLDEIPSLSTTVQRGLLRVLGDGEFTPMGAERPLPVNCRLTLASNRPLDELVADQILLADLRWRASLFEIPILPLVARPVDMLVLADHYFERARAEFAMPEVTELSPDAIRRLLAHDWPGNVREVKWVVEHGIARAALHGESAVEGEHLAAHLPAREAGLQDFDSVNGQEILSWAVRRCGGNKSRAASLLGVHRNTVIRRSGRSGALPKAV